MPDDPTSQRDEHWEQRVFEGRQPPPSDALHDARLLTGYLARVQGRWRLYPTVARTRYVEITDDDVVGTEKLAATAFAPARTAVWVRAETDLSEIRPEAARAPADFLREGMAPGFAGDMLENALEADPVRLAIVTGLTPWTPYSIATTCTAAAYTTSYVQGCPI